MLLLSVKGTRHSLTYRVLDLANNTLVSLVVLIALATLSGISGPFSCNTKRVTIRTALVAFFRASILSTNSLE